MRLAARRTTVALWAVAFAWWCWDGAAWMLQFRGFDEPATLVPILLLPGTIIGVLLAMVAFWKPNRWTLVPFAIASLVQIALVVERWR